MVANIVFNQYVKNKWARTTGLGGNPDSVNKRCSYVFSSEYREVKKKRLTALSGNVKKKTNGTSFFSDSLKYVDPLKKNCILIQTTGPDIYVKNRRVGVIFGRVTIFFNFFTFWQQVRKSLKIVGDRTKITHRG